jgi:Cu+-exporting ATPase
MDVREFFVEGMSCAGCALRIEKSLSEKAEVRSAVVNFAARTAVVETSFSDEEVCALIGELGYRAQRGDADQELAQSEERQIQYAKAQLISSAWASVPLFVIAMSGLHFPGVGLVQLALCSWVLAGPGRKFYVNAYKLARSRDANMDTLIALGTGAAYLYSLWILLSNGGSHYYFESAAVIVTLILLGKFLEERARQGASRAVRALMALQPETALVVSQIPSEGAKGEIPTFVETPVKKVRSGEVVVVRAGDRIPVDGVVLSGSSFLDASLLTGESAPVAVDVKDSVAAGCLNVSGVLYIETRAVGAASVLGRIITTVKHAIGTKAPIQRMADKVASVFVPTILAVAFVTFLGWLVVGHHFSDALIPAIAVLVVACPCALGLATPTSILVATGRAARSGILIKDAPSLEVLHRCNIVVFDKTGTLTEGRPAVVNERWSSAPFSVERALILAAVRALEAQSSHPMAVALVKHLESAPSVSLSLLDVSEVAGSGISARVVSGEVELSVQVGKLPASMEPLLRTRFEGISLSSGMSLVPVAVNGEPVVVFEVRDTLRPDALSAVALLRANGVEPVMATGDREDVASMVARELDIRYFSQQNPQGKVDLIRSLQDSRHRVIMVGDGINDAPALATADVGIAMGSGTDAALATAGITLSEVSIKKVAEAIALSHATFRNIKQNLFWAFAYNVVLIPIAAFGGLTPMMAAGAMAFSSLFVVGNALRLRKPQN